MDTDYLIDGPYYKVISLTLDKITNQPEYRLFESKELYPYEAYDDHMHQKVILEYMNWKKNTSKTKAYRDMNRKVNIFIQNRRRDGLGGIDYEYQKDRNELFAFWQIEIKHIEAASIEVSDLNKGFITNRVFPYVFCETKREMIDVLNKYLSSDRYKDIYDKFASVDWKSGMYFEMYLGPIIRLHSFHAKNIERFNIL